VSYFNSGSQKVGVRKMLDGGFVSITLYHAELNLIFDKETLMKVMTLEKRATEGKLADKKRRHIIRLTWILILHGLVFNLMQMALILMLAPFFSDMEPSFFVLKLFFRAATVNSSWILRIIRSALNGLITSHCIVCGTNGTLFLLPDYKSEPGVSPHDPNFVM
jgi:hypothetical protein